MPTLSIVSPHHEGIKQEYEAAFKQWHQDKFNTPVNIAWKDLGGTGQIIQYIRNGFEAAKKRDALDEGIGVDLFFGGGAPAVDQLKSEMMIVPVDLPDDLMAQIPAELAGIRLYDPEHHWYGNVLAAFGIIYNVKAHKKLDIPIPATWRDLANPKYFGWLAMADPKSGSAMVCYELVLQRNGWQNGWPILLSMFANAKLIPATSNVVPQEVMTGNALAGVCIDFYGWDAMARAGKDAVRYVSPIGATAVTPDPIAMLRGAPHPQIAKRFIEFTLSEPGQALLCLPVGHELGPKTHEIRRLPIRPDIYKKYDDLLTVTDRPFTGQSTFKFDQQTESRRHSLLRDLIQSAAVDQKPLMADAWKAIIDAGQPADRIAIWNELPFSEREGLDLADTFSAGSAQDQAEVRKQWRAFFQNKYNRILGKK